MKNLIISYKNIFSSLRFHFDKSNSSVEHQLNAQEDVCTWIASNLAVAFNGAGYVKLSGLEIVWEIIGLDKNGDTTFVIL